MSIQLHATLSQFWHTIQTNLFPWLSEELGPLNEAHRKIIAILEMARVEDFIKSHQRNVPGRPPACRVGIARAFVAKASLNLSTTRQLLDRLKVDKVLRRICGFERHSDIPEECTFSRAFKTFSENKVPEQIHKVIIATYQSQRLVGHLSRDSTAIEAREKVSYVERKKVIKKPRGRPKKEAAPVVMNADSHRS